MKLKEEYYELKEKYEDICEQMEGSCEDIDCDKYIYKDYLKKSFKPILEHSFSCMSNLKYRKQIYERLLTEKKYKRFRHKKCYVCRKKLDELSNKSTLVSFTKPVTYKKRKGYEMKVEHIHKKCEKKAKPPKGWSQR